MWFVLISVALVVLGYFLIALSNRTQDSERVISFGEKFGKVVQTTIALLLALIFAGALFAVYFLHSLWTLPVHL
jgi:hypothetical protein